MYSFAVKKGRLWRVNLKASNENRVLHKNIYWLAASLGRVKIKIEISAKEMLKNAKEC